MDPIKQERGLDLEEFLNPKSKVSSLSTFSHVLWLKRWKLFWIWILLALPSASFLAFYDLPKSYKAVSYIRFPKVVGMQNNVLHDISLGEAQSVVRLFQSRKVLMKTIKERGLQFKLVTKNVYREQVLDSVGYTDATPSGRYRIRFRGESGLRVLHRPWEAGNWRTLHEGPAGPGGEVSFAGATLKFKPALLESLRGFDLDFIFFAPDEALKEFSEKLKVEPLDRGQVAVNYAVELEDSDPFLVAPVLNDLTRHFIAVYSGTTEGQDMGVIARMEKSLESARATLKAAQDKVADFYRRNQSRMAVREGNPYALASAQTRKSQVEGYLERLTHSLSGKPEAGATGDEKRMWTSEMLALLSGQGVQRAEALRGRVTELERKRIELAAKYTPAHPMLTQADGEIAALFTPVAKLGEEMRAQYRATLAQAGGEIARNLPGGVPDMGLELEARRLTEDRENAAHMLDNLQAELDRAKLGATPDLFKVDIIDPARQPMYEAPRLRDRLGYAGGAMVLAFFPGLLWMLAGQILFPRIWNKDDVEKRLKVKVLGQLFHIEGGNRRGEIPGAAGSPLDPCLLHLGRLPSQADVEAYRALRTGLETHFADPDRPESVCMLVTSTQPNEGKSLISANLAVGFARRGRRTLLVDADFRHGRLERMFGYRPQEGLADVLHSAAPTNITQSADPAPQGAALAEFMARAQARLLPTPQPNLSLMPKGTFDEEATEAAFRASMDMFVRAARSSFDVVILDGPPIIVTSDPTVLARLTGNVLFVIRSGQISAHEASRALEPLRDRGLNLAVAVNGIRRSPSDENYYAKYGYYYLMPGAPSGSRNGSAKKGPQERELKLNR